METETREDREDDVRGISALSEALLDFATSMTHVATFLFPLIMFGWKSPFGIGLAALYVVIKTSIEFSAAKEVFGSLEDAFFRMSKDEDLNRKYRSRRAFFEAVNFPVLILDISFITALVMAGVIFA